jgi:hypothetical protein
MARTTFSGPVASDNGFLFPATTAATLADITATVNTTNKFVGKSVVDLATGIIYTATGALAASVWKGSNASTVTPV